MSPLRRYFEERFFDAEQPSRSYLNDNDIEKLGEWFYSIFTEILIIAYINEVHEFQITAARNLLGTIKRFVIWIDHALEHSHRRDEIEQKYAKPISILVKFRLAMLNEDSDAVERSMYTIFTHCRTYERTKL